MVRFRVPAAAGSKHNEIEHQYLFITIIKRYTYIPGFIYFCFRYQLVEMHFSLKCNRAVKLKTEYGKNKRWVNDDR